MPRSAESRQESILRLIRSQGFVSNETLAQNLKVSVQTIRCDLDQLESEGRLMRRHGGADFHSSIENVSYADRRILNQAAKDAVGELVARHVPARSSVFINIGMMTEAVARSLAGHEGLRLVTNNLQVAMNLSRTTDFDVNVVGARVRNRDGGLVGSVATEL